MPVRKEEASRALELLEQYHRRLNSPEDAQLRSAIERVIKIFQSQLFHALIEIQEFYEVTLLDDTKSVEQKVQETTTVADRWANVQNLMPPSHQPGAAKRKSRTPQRADSPAADTPAADTPAADTPAADTPAADTPAADTPAADTHEAAPPQAATANSDGEGGNFDSEDESAAFEVTLQRGARGFGFSIAGGTDEPHLAADDPRLCVTKVVPAGAADGSLRLGDIVLAVNGADVSAVPHAQAVDALKNSGDSMRLLVLRSQQQQQPDAGVGENLPEPLPQPLQLPQPQQVLLTKTQKGLGFSVAGGVDSQHLPGDSSIFVTKIIDGGAAQQQGGVQFGDRLLAVDGAPLSGCTHQQAVAALKATGAQALLAVMRPEPHELQALLAIEESGWPAEQQRQPPQAKKSSKKDKKRGSSEEAAAQPAEDEEDGQAEAGGEDRRKSKGIGGLFGIKKK